MKPIYEVSINGSITGQEFKQRLTRLRIRDSRGFEADQCDIELDDSDGLLAIPPTGAVLEVKLGFQSTGLVEMGQFTVDEVEHTGPPDVLVIKASSADFTRLKGSRTQAWDWVFLEDVISSIAVRYGLEPAINPDLAGIFIEHIDQTDESDAHFLTRLAKLHNAISTIKQGYLIFSDMNQSQSVSGLALEPMAISRSDGDRYRYRDADKKSKFTGVKARWLDREQAKAIDVIVGEEGTLKALKKTYATDDEAKQAALAEWNKIQRAGKSLELNLAAGRPEIITESLVKLSGFKSQIQTHDWIVNEVEHELTAGLTTKIICS